MYGTPNWTGAIPASVEPVRVDHGRGFSLPHSRLLQNPRQFSDQALKRTAPIQNGSSLG